MNRGNVLTLSAVAAGAFCCGVLFQKYIGVGRLIPHPDPPALRYDERVPQDALAALGEPAAPFEAGSAYVYSTGPEERETGRAGFDHYRYYEHYRDVADYLVSDAVRHDARREHDAFWAVAAADKAGDPFVTQRRFLAETLGIANAGPGGKVLARSVASDAGSFTVSRLEMQSRIPAISFPVYQAIPSKTPPRGVVIALHGHSGAPEKVVGLEPRDYTRAFGAELARAGYSVFAPYVLNVSRLNANISGLGMLYSRNTKYSIDLQKLLAVVDHIDADPELRGLPLAVYGISYGGRLAVLLAAIDKRIDSVVTSGGMRFSRDMLQKHFALDSEVYWGDQVMFNHPLHIYFEFADLARLVSPRPLIVEMGAYDLFDRPASMVEEWRQIRTAYAEMGASDRVKLIWFRGYHETAPSLVIPALDQLLH